MPLNKKGKKIMTSMKKQYGKKRGEQVFYASLNKKKIKGVNTKRGANSTSINTTSRRLRSTNTTIVC